MIGEVPKYICYRVTAENVTISGKKIVMKEVSPEEVAEDLRPVVRGKWEELEWGFKYLRCTECGYEHRFGKFNYCPNCGAKMDEVSE